MSCSICQQNFTYKPTKRKSDYYTYDYRPDKYRAQEFFSDLVSDISKLFFIKSLHERELYFVFDENELKISTAEDDLSPVEINYIFVIFLKVIIRKKICFYFNKFYWMITYPKKTY